MLFSKEKEEIEKENIKNEKKEKERLRKKKASMLNIAAVSALSNSINFCDAAAPVGMCKYVSFTVIILKFRFKSHIRISYLHISSNFFIIIINFIINVSYTYTKGSMTLILLLSILLVFSYTHSLLPIFCIFTFSLIISSSFFFNIILYTQKAGISISIIFIRFFLHGYC